MTPTDLLARLREFHRDKLALLVGHESAARQVGQYDFNNTYQNIIGREEVHLSWLEAAIRDLGGSVGAETPARPPRSDTGPSELFEEDARQAQAFVDGWRDRVEQVTNARHRQMLRLVLGEMLEHTRFFEQAAAGRLDLLGRQPPAHRYRRHEVRR